MNQLLTSAVLVTALALQGGCAGDSSTVAMTRTIDILATIAPSHRPTNVTGFQLGNDLHAPIQTSVTWTAETTVLPSAGGETPPCNDGSSHRLRPVDGDGFDHDPFLGVWVVGDTGSDDISDDRDCGCDTHISRMLFKNLHIISGPTASSFGLINTAFGKEQLCPNRLDDIVVGDNEFGGPVTVDLNSTLRVTDGGLFLDVTYIVREQP